MLIIKRYTASWCGPCKMLAPIFTELQGETSNVLFHTIDVDQNRDEATKNNVASVPTVIFEKNGQEVHRFVGVKPKSAIQQLINQFS